MSLRPTDPDLGLARLGDEGYHVELREQHLLLHDVPYVTSNRQISKATLVCPYIVSAGSVQPPDNHQVWWTGEYPCLSNGRPIEQIRNEDQSREIFPGCLIHHRFSNKPDGYAGFPDYYTKLLHYVSVIQAQAQAIDPSFDARGNRRGVLNDNTVLPFEYADTASTRAAIQSTSKRLGLARLAIVGVGGTGAYVLDQVAKTPVAEIHLFDGDIFQQHNAFRAPGAASKEDIAKAYNKAIYFKLKYEVMHRGIVSHPNSVNHSNVADLNGFDFVFVCVDDGATRSMLAEHLIQQQVPFIDVGMNLQLVPSTGKLVGACRCTLCTPEQNTHFALYAPTQDDSEDSIYRENIQIADMNAINAQLAVMKWKQHCGFYQDDFNAFNVTFSVNSMSLIRDVLIAKP